MVITLLLLTILMTLVCGVVKSLQRTHKGHLEGRKRKTYKEYCDEIKNRVYKELLEEIKHSTLSEKKW